MRFSHFFIDRPIFAAVLAIILDDRRRDRAAARLPVSEYPEIAPPTVNIRATYPGASAEVLAETVATPIEQEVNGVDDMLYITSQSVGDGTLYDRCRVQAGTDSIPRRCWCRTASRSRRRGCRRMCSGSASRCGRRRPT